MSTSQTLPKSIPQPYQNAKRPSLRTIVPGASVKRDIPRGAVISKSSSYEKSNESSGRAYSDAVAMVLSLRRKRLEEAGLLGIADIPCSYSSLKALTSVFQSFEPPNSSLSTATLGTEKTPFSMMELEESEIDLLGRLWDGNNAGKTNSQIPLVKSSQNINKNASHVISKAVPGETETADFMSLLNFPDENLLVEQTNDDDIFESGFFNLPNSPAIASVGEIDSMMGL